MAIYIEKKFQRVPLTGAVKDSLDSNSTTDAPSIRAVKEIDDRVALIEENGVTSGDTIPVGGTMLYNGDTVPTGWEKVEEVYSNPNLLINSDFRNPINQRGLTSYWKPSSWTYNVDRWTHLWNSVILNDGYIKVYNDTGETGTTYFKQIFEHSLGQADYTITVSVKEITGTVQVNGFGNLKKGINAFTVKNTSLPQMQLNLVGESSIELYWIKLEQGEIATPFVPRLIGEELALCQRYYQTGSFILTRFYEYTTNQFGIQGNLRCPMRDKPTVTVKAVSSNAANNGTDINATDVTIAWHNNEFVRLKVTFGENLRNSAYAMYCTLDCDAEIY